MDWLIGAQRLDTLKKWVLSSLSKSIKLKSSFQPLNVIYGPAFHIHNFNNLAE